MNYICKKAFFIEGYDDDGFCTGKFLNVKEGDQFRSTDDMSRLIGNLDTIHLDAPDGTWLEISKGTLDEHFEETGEGDTNG